MHFRAAEVRVMFWCTCSILVSDFDGTLLPSAAELAACKEPGNAFSIFLT